MVVHQDDDSATTWGRGTNSDEEDDPPNILTQIPPQESEASSCMPSPMTQTLNILSQNMDDMRYDSLPSATIVSTKQEDESSLVQQDTKNQETASTKEARTATKSKPISATNQSEITNQTIASKDSAIRQNDSAKSCASAVVKTQLVESAQYDPKNPLFLDWKDYQQGWTRLDIRIGEDAGSVLGMRIKSSRFATSNSNKRNEAKSCLVLHTFGLARQYGLEEGDWICWPLRSPDQPFIQLAKFDLVQEWSKERPFHVCVLRQQNQRKIADTDNSEIGNPKQATRRSKDVSPALTCKRPILPLKKPTSVEQRNEAKALPPLPKSKKDTLSKSTAAQPDASTSQRRTTGHVLAQGIQTSIERNQIKHSANSKSTATNNSKANETMTTSKAMVRHGSNSFGSGPRNGRALPPKHVVQLRDSTTTSSTSKPTTNVVPFCLKCNTPPGTRQPRMHHAWCSRNDFFRSSGAQDIMKRLEHGLEVDCTACRTEYQTGRLLTRVPKHNTACLTYQERVKQRQEPQKTAKKTQNKKELKKGSRKPSSSGYLTLSSDSGDSDDMDDVSCYKPRKRKSKIHILSAVTLPASNKCRKTQKASKSTPKTSRPKQQNASRVTPLAPRNNTPSVGIAEEQNQVVKANWVSYDENPWGPPGHMDGDVSLYGPQRGMGHYETLSRSRRYVLDPFAQSSAYRNTHCTPQEGFTMLSLRREPLSTFPWGFKVVRDEFGHACLVESIDSLSPAAAASFVGEPANASSGADGLKVNDMILSINGKLVGGLTEVGVALELESCGPNLLLVVSRYKHAKLVQRRFVEVERQMLHAVDSAARDGRILGWIEVGNAKADQPEPFGSSVENPLEPDVSLNEHLSCTSTAIDPDAAQDVSLQAAQVQDAQGEVGNLSHEIKSATRVSSMVLPNGLGGSVACEQPGSLLASGDTQQSKVFSGDSDGSNEAWKEDENAWNGCVCGKIHNKNDDNDEVFWIQCEPCQSWYDVSQKCVGFNVEQAKETQHWNCWACPSVVTTTSNAEAAHYPPPTAVTKNGFHAEQPCDDLPPALNASSGKCRQGNPHDTKSQAAPAEIKEKYHPSLWNRVTSDGRLLPKSTLKRREDGTFRKPAGTTPRGMRWDYESGTWVFPNFNRGVGKEDAFIPTESKLHRTRTTSKATSTRTPPTSTSQLAETRAADSLPSELIGKATGAFNVGELVYVKPHSWPGKNCQGGIGHVSDSYGDEEGRQCYTVQYAIGSREKNVEAEYVAPYTFG